MTSENILVLIDFSDLSYASMDRALEINSRTGNVHVLTALSTIDQEINTAPLQMNEGLIRQTSI